MIPENSNNSLNIYPRYPKQNTKSVSWIGEEVKNLICFRHKAQKNEAISPQPIDDKASFENSTKTLNTVFVVNSSLELVYLKTVLKRIIDTASFVIPSPNTIENNFGSLCKSIKDTAATTSDEYIKDHNSKISLKVKVNGIFFTNSELYFCIDW
ncbi:unnamed protein product [Moneuplotes crassus]|uniref:Uncharacterized protein n=1 Tax=Euplotes crassus TaxID=5936 RepID=A0AAD1X6Z0_EUPCR|nr:unnamed protein product [Moneuplotes crassus]